MIIDFQALVDQVEGLRAQIDELSHVKAYIELKYGKRRFCRILNTVNYNLFQFQISIQLKNYIANFCTF
jgi:hypothetical protein